MTQAHLVTRSLILNPCFVHNHNRNPSTETIDNIKMDLVDIGSNIVDWLGLVQDRYRWKALVNSVMNLRVP
jgi:hypothetical protein